MPAKALMIVGTTSHAGKSLIAASFCRLFKEAGYKVAPFKAQNMSNNSYVTLDGGEMGRAQVAQAEAAGVIPHTDMNPVLLKPTSDEGCQVIVQGKPIGTMKALNYYDLKKKIWEAVKESYDRLIEQYDVIVLEGAGSPVEINIKDKDIVNMSMALYANAQTILVADIERGGVFASAVGTYQLLTKEERDIMCGTIVNKFRGDVALFSTGPEIMEKHTGKPVLGVMPYIHNLFVDDEDGVSFDCTMENKNGIELNIAAIALPRISNLTDFTPFWQIPNIKLNVVRRKSDLKNADCIIIPGTKSTFQDLEWLKTSGIAEEIIDLHKNNDVPVIGICGGYQMMCNKIINQSNDENWEGDAEGLGLIDAETIYNKDKEKITVQVEAMAKAGHPFLKENTVIKGYEIHSGETKTGDASAHRINKTVGSNNSGTGYDEGFQSCKENSFVLGTYIHGIFDEKEVLEQFINKLRTCKNLPEISLDKELANAALERNKSYSLLAQSLRENLNLDIIKNAVGLDRI